MNAIDTNETLKSIETPAREVDDDNTPISSQRHRIISEAITLINGLEQGDNPETGDGFVQVPIAKQGREEEQLKSLNNRSDSPLWEDAYSSQQRYRELRDNPSCNMGG